MAFLMRTFFTLVLTSSLAAPATAQTVRREDREELPLCRLAEPGERCRTRNGEIRIRTAAAPGTGGQFQGDEVDFERQAASRSERVSRSENLQPHRLDAPEPEAMDCENCDDDEDLPQGPIDNTPRPQEPAPQEPEDDEDCTWRNPSEGPDQEFCDE